MIKTKHAGMSGKGFYAALSLSVAMVGAACWYAYTGTTRTIPPAESSLLSETAPRDTAVSVNTAAQQTTKTETVTQPVSTKQTDASAEEAAAILRPATTEPPAETTITATTTAPVVHPIPPIEGNVLQAFSDGELVKSQTTGIWQTHNGTDYEAAPGTEVRCVMPGTVISVERDPRFGVSVTMMHEDGTITRYCGLNEGLAVEAGSLIAQGTVLGAVGDTNEAEGALPPHLHFEVLQNDIYVDPALYLAGMPTHGDDESAAN